MSRPKPEAPRVEPVVLPDLETVTVPPERSDLRELERYTDLDLTDVDLRAAAFTECAFSGCRLSGSRWDGTRLRQVRLTDLDTPTLAAPRGDWREVEVAGCRIGSAEAYESTWSSVVLAESKINYLNARGATWSDVLLRDCVLDELDLGGATVGRLAFSSVRVGTLTVTGAQLTDVDLRGLTVSVVAGLSGLAGAWIDEPQLSDLAPLLAAELGLRLVGG